MIVWKKSFSGDLVDLKKSDDNSLLADETNAFLKRGIAVWPAVIINNNTYRGDLLPASNVFEAVCESFDDMPPPCLDYFNVGGSPGPKSLKSVYVAAFFCMLFITLFLFICYRRFLKIQLNKEIQLQLNATVSQYFALNEGSEKDTKRLVEAQYNH